MYHSDVSRKMFLIGLVLGTLCDRFRPLMHEPKNLRTLNDRKGLVSQSSCQRKGLWFFTGACEVAVSTLDARLVVVCSQSRSVDVTMMFSIPSPSV